MGYLKLKKRVKELLLNNSCFENKINEFIFHNHLSLRSSMNGYASVIPEKVKQIIVFFASALQGVFETKLNKLLFYSDFLLVLFLFLIQNRMQLLFSPDLHSLLFLQLSFYRLKGTVS